ncbi:tetrahydrofolate dehydrogenase/cyclohydrolase [Dunaliella salina]|uniref:Tetrahydrofolate dehydrogenase/cyclohydrolase n=1 Tax=Dunaliella salina TaxID=3046 RepID=A0ABQ7H3N9_DUNSA|nr:tetrahydrofolate dehydrogenase/cyclohydrolase [Dunaliella salina]|eukprot:KAF5841485.1 tetrahydrofolate dehydrogenase/cyclohydrolase [Dunaliella salina]
MALSFSQACHDSVAGLRNSTRGVPVTSRARSASLRVCAAAAEGTATIIDGKMTAAAIRKEIATELAELKAKTSKVPGLAVVLVGNRKDSETYVRSKKKSCAEVGIESFGTELSDQATEEEILKVVADYNANPAVNGILVQLPLPKGINEQRVLDAISLEKDVDGFSPENIGQLAMRGRTPRFVPCTPKGCIELLERYNVPIAGKNAVVVGRSNIVGLPAALLLQNRDATVTIVHSRTKDAQKICADADIVIAALGKAEFMTGDWIKPGAAVIDVGINAVDDKTSPKGYKLVGDVNYKEASAKANWITPVPGGVGPMTICMLLKNTLEGFKQQNGL